MTSAHTTVIGLGFVNDPFEGTDEQSTERHTGTTSSDASVPTPTTNFSDHPVPVFSSFVEFESSTTTIKVESFPPAVRNGVDVAFMIMTLVVSSQEAGSKNVEIVIKMKQSEMKGLHIEALQKMLEAVEKMAKAEKGGLFGKIFGWIAVAAVFVAAVVTVNPVLMGVAVLGVAMMVAQETGLLDKLAENIGTELFIALLVLIMVVMIVMPLAMPAAAANTGRTATILGNVALGVEGGAGIATGAAQITASSYRFQSSKSTAEANHSVAQAERVHEYLDEIIEFFKEFMQKNEKIKQDAIAILDTHYKTNVFISENTA